MNKHGFVYGTALGALIAIVVCVLTIGTKSDIVLEVPIPTIVYEDDQIANATGSYVAIIEDLQAGVNETAIAESVQTAVAESNVMTRQQIATAIASNEQTLANRVIEKLMEANGGTPVVYPTPACPMGVC